MTFSYLFVTLFSKKHFLCCSTTHFIQPSADAQKTKKKLHSLDWTQVCPVKSLHTHTHTRTNTRIKPTYKKLLYIKGAIKNILLKNKQQKQTQGKCVFFSLHFWPLGSFRSHSFLFESSCCRFKHGQRGGNLTTRWHRIPGRVGILLPRMEDQDEDEDRDRDRDSRCDSI